jgi:hypothetical protein
MVSNTLDMTLEDLVDKLYRFAMEYAADPEYIKLRSEMPADFPF